MDTDAVLLKVFNVFVYNTPRESAMFIKGQRFGLTRKFFPYRSNAVRLLALLCFVYIVLFGLSIRHTSRLPNTIVVHSNILKYDKVFNKSRTGLKILIWTEFFGRMQWFDHIQQHIKNCNCSCDVTTDKSQIKSADVVVFHFLDLYLWTSLPNYRAEHQIWVLYIIEAPPHIHWVGINVPKLTFNWTMSYRRDSDIIAPYGDFIKMTKSEKEIKRNSTISIFDTKTKMVASVIGNCVDDARRYYHVRELNKYVKIDQYGDCGNLHCPRSGECNKMMKSYKFKIAFENSNCRHYVSEKFWEAIRADSIPIVNWKPNQVIPAPPNSYINVHDFKNMKELGDYLIKIGQDKALYDSYFEWRYNYKLNDLADSFASFRSLCDRLANPTSYQSQVIVDPWKWIEDDTCERWSIRNVIGRRWDRLKHVMQMT